MLPSLLLLAGAHGTAPGEPQIQSIQPATIRVGERVALSGVGFGRYHPRRTAVRFATTDGEVGAGAPYVWRDDWIEVWVPTGRTDLESVHVVHDGQVVASARVSLAAGAGSAATFVERTAIVNHTDVSGFLGAAGQNAARTKDAEVGDVDGDGWPDLLDNNSSNLSNGTHSILRLNRAGASFTGHDWEPNDPTDAGTFAVQVDPGGDFVGSAVIYDGDLVDLNNDRLPDWVMVAQSPARLRLALNGHLGVPGAFHEATQTWFGSQFIIGNPDDVRSADVDGDGFLDIVVGIRFNTASLLYLNDRGTGFEAPIAVPQTSGGFSSMHDSFFLDANADGYWDVCLVNESGDSQIHLHDRDLHDPSWIPDQTIPYAAATGIRGDFDGDQVDDFVLGGLDRISLFLNDRDRPGRFTEVPLGGVPGGGKTVYDLEVGDLNLDGHLDLVAAIVATDAGENGRIYLGSGDGTLVNATPGGLTDLLPGAEPYERLSADLIDFDLDGDLDLYLTGADGDGAPGAPFGAVPNQLWENELVDRAR